MIDKTNTWICRWLAFLAITIDFSDCSDIPFKISETSLTAKEGSCIEISCTATSSVSHAQNNKDVWYWIKDPKYNDATRSFDGTIVYSNKKQASRDYEHRVEYKGASVFEKDSLCSIKISNLQKTDSGNYAFRFEGSPEKYKWKTDPEVNLRVEENPCKITFDKPPVVNESGAITLQCSTSKSCRQKPEFKGFAQENQSVSKDNDRTIATVRFTADWRDDGKMLTCQVPGSSQTVPENCLAQSFSLTVEYAPKETEAAIINPKNVIEGRTVILTCSTKGHPNATLSWFKDGNKTYSGNTEWRIVRIQASDSGVYHCEAKNKHGNQTSNRIPIDVKYRPVGVKVVTNKDFNITEKDAITLTCAVYRTNSEVGFTWMKNNQAVGWQQIYVFENIQPGDSGSYTCIARNVAGSTTSESYQINVRYSPRNTLVSSTESSNRVKVKRSLTLTCNTKAYPEPNTYYWYYSDREHIRSSQWKAKTNNLKTLYFGLVEREDDGCYMCSAENYIGQGANSSKFCIQVLYPPTNFTLSMVPEATEGQSITIRCTVESVPSSRLTLTWASKSKPDSSSQPFPKPISGLNTVEVSFLVTPAHAGFYFCDASNSEGRNRTQKKLVVTYSPKTVTVNPSSTVVNEDEDFKLSCDAQSNPPVTSYTWFKTEAGTEKLVRQSQTFIVTSVTPSDSGLYHCVAKNNIGTGKSQQTEVKVKYAPKHTEIVVLNKTSKLDGDDSVTLSCRSSSYPPIDTYEWFTVKDSYEMAVSDNQNFTVSPKKPGIYFCIASNEIASKKSDTREMFLHRRFWDFLPFILATLLAVIAIFLIVFLCRRNNKTVQQRRPNTLACWSRFGFLGWSSGTTENLVNDTVLAEPFRSRDDLLPDRLYRPQPQQPQSSRPRPDSTPASNINTVYCTVNLPKGGQGRSQPIRGQNGPTEDDGVNYASLHFDDQQKKKQAPKAKMGEEDVYAKVVKPNPHKKEHGKQKVYENVSEARAHKRPTLPNSDTDTSEEDVELNYSVVSFKAKSGQQRANHSRTKGYSSSDEDERTQYSDVKI